MTRVMVGRGGELGGWAPVPGLGGLWAEAGFGLEEHIALGP